LLRGRFIVSCVGAEQFKAKPPSEAILYSFPLWIGRIELQIADNTSIFQLASIIEKESFRTFTETIAVEKLMKDGTLKHTHTTDRFLAQFFVAGFDNRIPTLIQINYEYDWKGKHLIGPTREIEFPRNGLNTPLVYTSGRASTIVHFAEPSSDAYKRMMLLDPIALGKLLARKEISPNETVHFLQSLIGIEATIDPSYVGRGATVVLLPSIGKGSVTQLQSYPSLPKGRTEGKANKAKEK
jgi:hypothetical protein